MENHAIDQCVLCFGPVGDTGSVECERCGANFHLQCVGLTARPNELLDAWHCFNCQAAIASRGPEFGQRAKAPAAPAQEQQASPLQVDPPQWLPTSRVYRVRCPLGLLGHHTFSRDADVFLFIT